MKINFKLISLMLILFFISVSAVSADDTAQTDVVNGDDGTTQNIDNIDETGTNNNNDGTDQNIDNNENQNNPTTGPRGFLELQKQIWGAEAGDTIELDSDYIYDNERDGITIDKTLTLDGKGHTLDANHSAIFYIKTGTANVVIKNMTLINGEKGCGGAVFADSGTDYLTIVNCIFKDNKATTSNVGGALLIKGSHSTIYGCYFENNVAPSSGGAIRLEADSCTISNSIFVGNKATESLGGAINALGHNNQIIGNTFSRNIAGRDGGAIDIEGTEVAQMGTGNIISNNVFTYNQGSYGGAINVAGKNCEISNNNFTSNHAERLGGAIRWNGANTVAGKITGNRFESNDAKSGGAIYVADAGITISDNKLNNNKATSGAGGAINVKGNSATISNNEITKSSSTESGGALYIEGKSAKLQNNQITQSSAKYDGGALYLNGASATITGNKFIENNAGELAGAALIKTSSANIKNNEFTSNVAKSSGGAVFIEGAKITVDNNEFSKNQAGSKNVGGAIRFNGNDAIITKNKFTSNTAGVGFAYYGSGENPTISGNTFSPKKSDTERWEKTKTKLTTPTKTFKKSAKTKKVVITLKSASNKAIKNMKITLKVNKKTYSAKTNAKGQATIKVKLTKKGTYKYTAKFAGSKYYYSISKNGKIKIK